MTTALKDSLYSMIAAMQDPGLRRTGRTSKLLAAASNTDSAFVCQSVTQRKIIQKDYPANCWLTTVSQCLDGETLSGIRKNLIFDHYALEYLLTEIARELDRKDREIEDLKGEKDAKPAKVQKKTS